MKKKLQQNILSWFLYIILYFTSFPIISQTIGIPTVNSSGGPITVSFSVTNGNGSPNYFNGSTNYIVYLSNASGINFTPIHTFNSSVFPVSINGESCIITKTIPIPNGTVSGSNYKIAIGSLLPNFNASSGTNASLPFTLYCDFNLPSTLNGFIKSSSPALTYYLLTITNSGTLTDSYSLSSTQTGTFLDIQFQTLNGTPITLTPLLDPGESYSFIIQLDTPNGTNPNNFNYNTINVTSNNCSISKSCLITTYIYGGAGNPNLPNSPDLQVIKTANTAIANVGDFIDYTITMRNNTTKVAANPVIKDFLPNNVELISYSKLTSDSRNIIFTYDNTLKTLTALLEGNLLNSSLPVTINIRVKTNCNSAPLVLNSTEIYTVSGDNNPLNDISSVSTSVNFDLTNSSIGTWTGLVSNDWFDCRNWSCGVIPTNSINVIIPNVLVNPVINSLSPYAPLDKIARCFNITIQGSRSLSMINASNLYVAGDWNNFGIFSPGNGTITFNGSVSNSYQQLTDSSYQPNFNNLILNVTNGCKGLLINDGYGLFISNNLDLISGTLRLNGKSQLIQTKTGVTTNSILGSGKIQKDQQGQSNKYNYNFWSSPVGVSNYTVSSVIRDGTNPTNPLPINWINGYDGSPTTPISLASYWIFKYQNLTNNYSNWTSIGPYGSLNVGQGFTLKGSGTLTETQNYTFEGKPNNGLISNPIAANNLNLSGNPYPSAIDAYQFIDDNISSINGVIYLWEQSPTNSSHYLASYQGGYAMLTKTGGTPAIAPSGILGVGTSTKIPKRFIPVGQGFFVNGNASGGTINFQNSQRAFKQETDVNSNFMFRNNNSIVNENFKKIRLGFKNNNTQIQREILCGFMNQFASNNFDYGYDGEQIDSQNNDMYFYSNEKNLSILGLGNFTLNTILPLGIKIQNSGNYTISLNNLENFTNQENIYLYDSENQNFHNLKNGSFSINLNTGTYNNRFSIRFTTLSAKTVINEEKNETKINYYNNQLVINSFENIKNVEIYNLVGQKINQWTFTNSTKFETIDLTNLNETIYIVKIDFDSFSMSKKIIK